MPVGQDIVSGFNEALNKADQILSDFLDQSGSAWETWEPKDPVPDVSFEEFDYNKHFAETIINSCHNSASNGTLTIPSIVGGYPAIPTGTFTSISPAVCTWKEGTDLQGHINVLYNHLKGSLPAPGGSPSPTAMLDLAMCMADVLSAMVTGGEISAKGVVGTFTVPGSPPVTTVVSVDVSGTLVGSSSVLASLIFQVLDMPSKPPVPNEVTGELIGTAFITYCASLTGSVIGSGAGAACAGAGAGFVVV